MTLLISTYIWSRFNREHRTAHISINIKPAPSSCSSTINDDCYELYTSPTHNAGPDMCIFVVLVSILQFSSNYSTAVRCSASVYICSGQIQTQKIVFPPRFDPPPPKKPGGIVESAHTAVLSTRCIHIKAWYQVHGIPGTCYEVHK